MCGITGMVGPGAEDDGLLARMMERVAHRGPDDTGRHLDTGVALGHTRLSIIDLAGGHEPIFDAEERRSIIYNGEVYNHIALRRELEGQGIRFKTHTDAEVPLHLLAPALDALAGVAVDAAPHAGHERIRAALDRLDGMFAFAIWDPATKRLFAARDPYGIKPFFYTRVGGRFLFGSEMKALLADPDVPAALDLDAFREKAAFEYLLPHSTYLQGIHELPPGHFLITDGAEVRIERYHSERTSVIPAEPDAMSRRLLTLLERAVEKRLMSEVPLGAILSGGLDSSLIAAIDRKLDPDRAIATFSIAEDESNPDFAKSRIVAAALGTDHKEWLIDHDDFQRDYAEMIWANEDIDHTTYFFYPLFRNVKQHATVGLCGQGADEVFGGYDRYKELPKLASNIRACTKRAWPDEPDRHDTILEQHYRDLRTILPWERGAQLAQFQLRLVDRNSMAHGAEIRVPFLDKEVVAFGRGLDTWQLIDPDGVEKKALRMAAAHTPLPKEITDRPKRPAGWRTSPTIVQRFERDVEKAYPSSRRAKHPLAKAFAGTAEIMGHDMMEEIFVHNRGARPKDLHWNDLV